MCCSSAGRGFNSCRGVCVCVAHSEQLAAAATCLPAATTGGGGPQLLVAENMSAVQRRERGPVRSHKP